MITLNQKTRTVKMTRSEMNRISMALTSVLFSVDDDTSTRKMWEEIKAKFDAQLDEQDKNDRDFPT